jgi:hypothetical protein
MIATATTEISFAVSDSVATQALSRRHRRVSSEAARGMEKLSHAIEYLADEFVNDGGPNNDSRNRLDAVQLLMGLHRHVYVECQEVPSLLDRCRLALAQLLA